MRIATEKTLFTTVMNSQLHTLRVMISYKAPWKYHHKQLKQWNSRNACKASTTFTL